jgi:ribosomal protein S6
MHKESREGERRLGYHIHYHREGVYICQGWTTQKFEELKQSNKAAIYDS